MSNIQHIKDAIKNRDVRALSNAVPSMKANRQTDIIDLFNGFFKDLKALFPANLSHIKTQDDFDHFRKQWVKAFAENGITTMEQIDAGLAVARRQQKPFMPSPGQFIDWCRGGEFSSAGLPDEQQLADRVLEFSVKKSGYRSAEEYPFSSNAEYWMVTRLYHKMRDNAWTEADLRKHAKYELESMLIRINAGQQIPAPKPQLDKKYNPVPAHEALSKIADLKRQIRRTRR